MSQAAHPSADLPEADEDLVAYLDGELDEDGARRVEARLAADPAYRRELARLEKAWDCLDALPETPVDPNFTRSTIEMVALAAREDVSAVRLRWPERPWLRVATLAAVLAATVAGGYLLAVALWPSPTSRLARDLPVLERLDWYLPVDNLAFLRKLSASAALSAFATAPSEESKQEAERAEDTRVSDDLTSAARLAGLSAEEKAALAASQQRFERLSAAEQTRLRTLAAEIAAADDRAQLEQTLAHYHAWLTQRSPGQQAELAGLAPDERLAAIERIAADEQRRRQRELSAADGAAVLKFFEAYLGEHREELLQQISEPRRREYVRWLEQARGSQRTNLLLMLFWQRRPGSDEPPRFPPLDEADVRRLLAELSPEARGQWEQAQSEEQRRRLLYSWAQSALRQRMNDRLQTGDARQITQEQLERFFVEKLSSDERARLLALPSGQMDRELRRMFLDNTPGERSRFFERSFGPSGRGPRGDFRPGGFPPPPRDDGEPGRHRPRRPEGDGMRDGRDLDPPRRFRRSAD